MDASSAPLLNDNGMRPYDKIASEVKNEYWWVHIFWIEKQTVPRAGSSRETDSQFAATIGYPTLDFKWHDQAIRKAQI